MLPKSARLFLFAAILASAHAKAEPRPLPRVALGSGGRATVSPEEGELDVVALRELSLLTVVGAQISGVDSTFLSCCLVGSSSAQRVPFWVDLTAAAALVATVLYLVLTGG
jgi:hypothetical protein